MGLHDNSGSHRESLLNGDFVIPRHIAANSVGETVTVLAFRRLCRSVRFQTIPDVM
jgi:hypothetical protein